MEGSWCNENFTIVPHTHSTQPSSIILPVDKRYENIIVLKQFMEFQKKLGFPRKIAVIFVKAEIWSINHQIGRIIGYQLLNAVGILPSYPNS